MNVSTPRWVCEKWYSYLLVPMATSGITYGVARLITGQGYENQRVAAASGIGSIVGFIGTALLRSSGSCRV